MGRSTSKVSLQGNSKKTKKTTLKRAVIYTVEAMEQRVMLAVTPHIAPWNEEGPQTITGVNTGSIIPA